MRRQAREWGLAVALGAGMAAAMAGPALAAGDPASPRTARAWPAHQDAALHDLAVAAEALRFGLAADPAATFAAMGQLQRGAVAVAAGGDARGGSRLSWFLRTAIVRIGGAAETLPSVGYYDPFVDAWLLTRWALLGGHWRLVAARWATGESVRAGPAAATSWPRDGEPWGAGLVRASHEALGAFDACCSLVTAARGPMPPDDASRAEVFGRVDRVEAGLVDWVRDPQRRAAAETLLTAIGDGSAARGAFHGGNAALADLPAEVRQTLLPVAGLQEPDGEALVLASQKSPGLLIAAEFGADHAMRGLTVIALDAEGRPMIRAAAALVLGALLAGAAAPAMSAPAAPTALQIASERARLAVAASPSHWLELLPAPAPTLAAALTPLGDEAFDADWSALVAGALETDREDGDSAVTLWFNPVFDAGLAVRWARTARGWTPVAGAPVTGELLRGEALSPSAGSGALAWPTASGSLAQNLAAAALQDDRAALAGAWSAALDASASDRAAWTRIAIARVDAAQRALRTMARNAGYGDAARRVRRALVEDDPARLPPEVQRDLARMGDAGLLDLDAVAALRRPDGWSLVLQSQSAAGAAWLAHFADPAPGHAAVLSGFTVAPLAPPPGATP